MKEINRITDQFQRAFDGDAWYGSSLRQLLADVTAEQAAAKPFAGSHNIWEIVLHIAAWQGAVRTRIESGWVAEPVEGDWPAVTETNETAWKNTRTALEHSHQALSNTVAQLTDERLDGWLGSERDRVTGGGVSVYVTLHGVLQHNIYHAGQIALLKKA